MAHKVTLPKDEWALIREADEVPERLRRAHLAAQGAMLDGAGITYDETGKPTVGSVTSGAVTEIGAVKDALILSYVKEWSLTEPITVDTLMDLPGGLYDALHDAASKAAAQGGILDASPDGAADPASPTAPLAE